MTPNEATAIGIALVACGFDLHSRRIPNALTLGAAAAALIVSSAAHGPAGALSSVAGWGVAAALLLPWYALGGMGAGDVKLIAAIGAWVGPERVIHAALYASIAGALLAVPLALAHGRLRQTLANVRLLVTHWSVVGFTPYEALTLATTKSPRLAYAVPILVGTAVAIWLR